MAVGEQQTELMAPVHLFSHGSTMMLGEDSASSRYWEKCGEEALAHGIEHVVMMVRPSTTHISHHRKRQLTRFREHTGQLLSQEAF